MKSEDKYVLMADIIASRKNDQNELMKSFKQLTNDINRHNQSGLYSPITITLGDEFQCIVKDVSSAVSIILQLEERLITDHYGFRLRYVLYEGKIDTPINKEIAYGMLGEALTNAREALDNIKSKNERYYFRLNNEDAADALGASLSIYQSITEDWNLDKDSELITKFIQLRDYKLVAEAIGKTRSQIWKRHKNLKIEAYFAAKQVTQYIADQV